LLSQSLIGSGAVLDGPVLKSFRRGTHRTASPGDTLARAALYAREMGITRLGNLTGLDRIGIPVTVAVRPNSRSVSVSQGKGVDLPQALASAMMEAVELFHGEDITAYTRVATYRGLASVADVVRPDSLCGTGVPLPDGAEIAWIEGHDLLQRKNCWVPWEIVHTDYTFSTDHSGNHFLSGTNGLASGNHILEALSSGICELIERDAVALWNARHLQERANCFLDLASVDDEDCRALLEAYEKARLAVRVWDVTSDIGVPAFVCDIPAARDDPGGGLRRFRGCGCHPSRTVALARALTEAAQIRLTYIAGIRDDLSDYEESAPQKLGAALLDAASESAEPASFHATPNFDADDLADDVRWQLAQLRSVGIERVIAIDLTRSDLGIPVVRTVIPGLEWDCSHPDYVPGPRARQINGNIE
jgi:YcaO-like protein with predicted kinase domain